MDFGSTRPSVLIADDSDRILQAVSNLLAEEFDVIGCVGDGAEAIKAVIRMKPDVVVMDIVMPRQDGIQAARRIKQMNSPTKIVFLSGLEDQEYVDASLAAGGSGFVFKSRAGCDLSLAIYEALACRVFVSTQSRPDKLETE